MTPFFPYYLLSEITHDIIMEMTTLDQGRTTDPLDVLKDSPEVTEDMVDALVEKYRWGGVSGFLEYLKLVEKDAVGISLPYGLEADKIDTLTVPEYLRS